MCALCRIHPCVYWVVWYIALAVFAHPNDEAFGTDGTISRYASEGIKTYLVCATRRRGCRRGEILIPKAWRHLRHWGQVREGELARSRDDEVLQSDLFRLPRLRHVGTQENLDHVPISTYPEDRWLPPCRHYPSPSPQADRPPLSQTVAMVTRPHCRSPPYRGPSTLQQTAISTPSWVTLASQSPVLHC